MTAPFIPLALPTCRHSGPTNFKPLDLSPRPPAEPTSPPPAPPTPRTPAPPKISLTRDGDRVTHIRIECSCGEVVELACEY